MVLGEKKKYLNTDLIPFARVNSKWPRHLNVKCKTVKRPEESIGENLDDLGFGNDFLFVLYATPKA